MTDVIVGVDGSTESRAALRWAGAVSAADGMTLRLLTAWEYPASTGLPFGPTQPRPADEMDAEARDRAQRALHEELGSEARAGVEVGRGPAARVLIERAGRREAAMLVVGARGLGGFDGLLLGSVSQQCAEHAPCPVVIVRSEPGAASGPRTIVAGVDGSATSTSALRWAAQLARDTNARVLAIHVVGGIPSAPLVAEAGRALEEWCEPLRSLGVDHESRVEGGDARSVLVDAAAVADADLIVVGTRGLGPIRGLLLGSVAGYLVRHAPRSVAVVRPSREQ